MYIIKNVSVDSKDNKWLCFAKVIPGWCVFKNFSLNQSSTEKTVQVFRNLDKQEFYCQVSHTIYLKLGFTSFDPQKDLQVRAGGLSVDVRPSSILEERAAVPGHSGGGARRPKRRGPRTTHSISRIQLSLLNSGLLPMHEDAKLMPLIPKGPIESSDFLKHVALLRKYEVLAKDRISGKCSPYFYD
ncbi:hypothetical protein CDAR_176231 [Caerostris darwini]|uniref:LAGLIDADG homing endonuclease n=1 Tax=Caerostris darwini TaxID=1538125 RepID=A0AAV4NXI6_9ARAC|nr:hypothetical protein CDAR_176231 [Caerostris darwini]